MNQTPLYDRHIALGGRIVDFGGWALPLQYSGILEEHTAVRQAAGLFDVSHMGELRLCGPDALDNLQHLLTNDLERSQVGQAVYSPMCAPDGGVVDDLLAYRRSDADWLLVVNAANTAVDEAWIRAHLRGQATLSNCSDQMAQLALQGPAAESILQALTDVPLATLRGFRFYGDIPVDGVRCLVSRTGYTGEDGFELYLAAEAAAGLWDTLLETGRTAGLLPAGLGARDTLRFEAALPLYGQELSRTISPLEAGLDRFVKLDKTDFIGRAALLDQQERGLARRRIGLAMTGRGIPRSHYEVTCQDRTVGFVTSGSYSPTLRQNLALALVDSVCADADAALAVIIRNRPEAARVTGLPFYARARAPISGSPA
jgi:aminomethyltransferase